MRRLNTAAELTGQAPPRDRARTLGGIVRVGHRRGQGRGGRAVQPIGGGARHEGEGRCAVAAQTSGLQSEPIDGHDQLVQTEGFKCGLRARGRRQSSIGVKENKLQEHKSSQLDCKRNDHDLVIQL